MKTLLRDFLVLLLLGALLTLFMENRAVFLFASLAMTLIAIKKVIAYSGNPRSIGVFDFFSTSILIAYASSTFISQVNIFRARSIDAASYFGVPQSSLSVALAAISVVCAILVLMECTFPSNLRFPRLEGAQLRQGVYVVFGVAIASAYALLSGQLGFQGAMFVSEDSSQISPFAAIVSFAIAPAGVLALCLASSSDIFHRRFLKWALYAVCAFLGLVMFTQGRRLVIYMSLLYLIFFKINFDGAPNRGKGYLFVVIVAAVAYLGYMLFFALRIAGGEAGSAKHILSLLTSALDILTHPGDHDFSFLLAENSLERPFVIKYLSVIIDKAIPDRWLSGAALFSTLMMSVPSVLIGAKTFAIDEELIHPKFGLPVVDEANSVLTTGFADFGWIGAISYPIIVALAILATLKIVRSSKITWMLYFSQFGALSLLLNVENSMTAYWGFVRATLAILFAASLFDVIGRLRLSRGL